ncbi:hypothetical protein AGMMS49957_18770 [Synergistales bacterium]|nr:hypothetical protein AGMMS49957_18770 [Synergistales bacterium]
MKYFIDSNVFLRYYSHDDAAQGKQVKTLLIKAKERKIEIYCAPPVFFEVAWVLKSAYSLKNEEILNVLESMLSTPNLQVLDEDIVRDAITLAHETGQGFADSYIAVTAKKFGTGVATFNQKHFSKLGATLYPFND